jgi:hypothetical protein
VPGKRVSGLFAEVHFTETNFAEAIISPKGYFIEGIFRRKDVSPKYHFIE